MEGYQREKIWDPVTRLWHWVLVLTVTTGWLLGEFLDFDTIQWHFYTGYTVLGLIAFRLLWGLFGPKPIRLHKLVPGPSATLQYLRTLGHRQPSGTPGHNPLGSLSVIAMLLILIAQPVTGLFSESEDFFEEGPLAKHVSGSAVENLTAWHHTLSDFVLILVGLHVAAIIFYLLWKRENLIRPMITGWKWVRSNK